MGQVPEEGDEEEDYDDELLRLAEEIGSDPPVAPVPAPAPAIPKFTLKFKF